MKILVIDNYDSFTYNLVYILRQECANIEVYRNDKINPDQCLDYDAIVLSPGPGVPKNAGNLSSIISHCAGKVPILGICLGHQAIAEFLGGKLRMLDNVYHGVQSSVSYFENEVSLFKNLPLPFQAGRYHSWDILKEDSPSIEITAISEDQSVMAIQNKELKLFGIQFHPESILTPEGSMIIQNFLNVCKE